MTVELNMLTVEGEYAFRIDARCTEQQECLVAQPYEVARASRCHACELSGCDDRTPSLTDGRPALTLRYGAGGVPCGPRHPKHRADDAVRTRQGMAGASMPIGDGSGAASHGTRSERSGQAGKIGGDQRRCCWQSRLPFLCAPDDEGSPIRCIEPPCLGRLWSGTGRSRVA
ncbi:MAG: hypothetical protein ACRYHQ_10670 [Janthinobacterium lividum]